MAIKETELVTLNGQTTAFGGRIYNANYQIGFNQSPSTINLSVINESGIYNISKSDMSILGSPDTISFGGRSIKMFPLGYSIEKSDGGKILTVKYVDPSQFYLDKKYVVLFGVHSEVKTNAPNQALMILGDKYYEVEEQDEDGNYIQTYSTEPPNAFDLGKSFYTAEELYNTMVEHNIPMHKSVKNILLNKDGATDYLTNYIGKLRSVLLAWANLMAFAFYWGEDNKLHLIDLEGDINVDLDKLNGIIPFADEESFSLEDTVDRGFSLYYGKEGNAQSEVAIGTSKTSIYFKRGLDENYNNRRIENGFPLSNSAIGKLNMLKIAALGENFYTAYTSWLTSNFPGVYDVEDENGATFFGIKNSLRVDGLISGENYQIALDYVDPNELYRDDKWALIRYELKKSKYPFSFFDEILKQFLTYEEKIKEDVFEKYQWNVKFEYDYENDTTFLRNDIPLINEGSDSDQGFHRAFFIAPRETVLSGLTEKEMGQLASNIFIPIDFSNISEAISKFFKPDEYEYAWLDTTADFASVMKNLDFKNKLKYKVDGFIPQTGAFNSITPRLEKIYLQEPSLNSNTISTDMQIETGGDLEISLAGRDFNGLADLLNESYLREDKTFRKTFSITGITLPENIGPEDGLQSVSISNTNDKGTISSYTVGNSFFKIPDKDIIIQKLEREKYAELKTRNNFTFIFNAGGFNV